MSVCIVYVCLCVCVSVGRSLDMRVCVCGSVYTCVGGDFEFESVTICTHTSNRSLVKITELLLKIENPAHA